jgi:hypothetical protein
MEVLPMQIFLESDWGRLAKFAIGFFLLATALSNTLPFGLTVMAVVAGFVAMSVAWSGSCPLFAVNWARMAKRLFSGKDANQP